MDCFCPGYMALFYLFCGWALAMITVLATYYKFKD